MLFLIRNKHSPSYSHSLRIKIWSTPQIPGETQNRSGNDDEKKDPDE
jgi:hypothetical protein